MTYVRNPSYWGRDRMFSENQEPYLDGIKLVVIVDMSSRVATMRTGKVDQSGPGANTLPQGQALDKQSWAENYLGLKGDEIQYVTYPVPHAPEWRRAFTPLAELPPSADGFDTKKL